MKKLIITAALAFFAFYFSFAQNIENSSFDSIYIGGIDRIWNWTSSDAFLIRSGYTIDTAFSLTPNTKFGPAPEILWNVGFDFTTPYSSVAVKLTTMPLLKKVNGQPFDTYITNGTHFTTGQDGYIDFSKGGSAFPYSPTKLKGYYQYFDTITSTQDSGKCIVLLKKYNSSLNKIDTIAYSESTISFVPTSGWANFEVLINYFSAVTPDSIVVVFFATTRPDEASELWIDELSFEYIPTTDNKTFESAELPIIYPNPNSGIVYIESYNNKIQYYRILDVCGRELQKAKFSEQISITELKKQVLIFQLFSETSFLKSYKIIRN